MESAPEEIMFRTTTSDFLQTMVDACLERRGSNVALVVPLELVVASSDQEEDAQRRYINFLFHRPGYTGVMVKVTPQRELYYAIKEWRVCSLHDSCWRSDGIQRPLSENYFEMCRLVNPNIAPIKLFSEARIGVMEVSRIIELKSHKYQDNKFTAEYA